MQGANTGPNQIYKKSTKGRGREGRDLSSFSQCQRNGKENKLPLLFHHLPPTPVTPLGVILLHRADQPQFEPSKLLRLTGPDTQANLGILLQQIQNLMAIEEQKHVILGGSDPFENLNPSHRWSKLKASNTFHRGLVNLFLEIFIPPPMI